MIINRFIFYKKKCLLRLTLFLYQPLSNHFLFIQHFGNFLFGDFTEDYFVFTITAQNLLDKKEQLLYPLNTIPRTAEQYGAKCISFVLSLSLHYH